MLIYRRILGLFMLALALGMTSCAPLSKAVPVISEAALVLTDATNAVNIAEAELAALHLSPHAQAEADADIAKARRAISAAGAVVAGAKDITDEQLDKALGEFRGAWGEIAGLFGAQAPPTARPVSLPVPLAMRHVKAP